MKNDTKGYVSLLNWYKCFKFCDALVWKYLWMHKSWWVIYFQQVNYRMLDHTFKKLYIWYTCIIYTMYVLYISNKAISMFIIVYQENENHTEILLGTMKTFEIHQHTFLESRMVLTQKKKYSMISFISGIF